MKLRLIFALAFTVFTLVTMVVIFAPTSYVITFDNITDELTALGKCDRLLREATEGLRAPIANLRTAVEMQADNPDMDVASRCNFDDVMFKESTALTRNSYLRLSLIIPSLQQTPRRPWHCR